MTRSFQLGRRFRNVTIVLLSGAAVTTCVFSVECGPSVELIDGVEVPGVWLRTDPGCDVGSDLRTWDITAEGVARRRQSKLSNVFGWFVRTTKSDSLWSTELVDGGTRSGFYGDPEVIKSIIRARASAMQQEVRSRRK